MSIPVLITVDDSHCLLIRSSVITIGSILYIPAYNPATLMLGVTCGREAAGR